jgi:hypothetical protein
MVSGTDKIEWGAVARSDTWDGQEVLIFSDGGWNPAEGCFLTEAQCRKFYGTPPREFVEKHCSVADRLEALARELRNEFNTGE